MSSTWTTQQVEALAPDDSSLKAGKGLSSPQKWLTLGRNEQAAWGECQGSGKDPYQTQVELAEPAFRCSCPSRKFPCKHGLGLLLLLAGKPAAFMDAEAPGWVVDWLASRAKRAEEREEKQSRAAERAAKPVDAAAQAKRAAQRLDRVTAGLDYVETWLKDMARAGLAGVPGQPRQFWENPAARMVDAQAPGVSRMIREMAALPAAGEGWQDRLLDRAGRLYLLIEGFRRLDTLPEATQADIRSLIGWNVPQEEVLSPENPGLRDRWLVVGQRVEDEERLRVQRTWLWGRESGRPALVLHFAPFGQPLDRSLLPGASLEAELVFYPGAFPLRALLRGRDGSGPDAEPPDGASVAAALDGWGAALSANPWLEEYPLLLKGVRPVPSTGEWRVRDEEGHLLPLPRGFERGWQLLALSGGSPLRLFGEWNGQYLVPLAVWAGSGFYPLTAGRGGAGA